MALDYEEKTIRGRVKEIKSQLRQAVLEGWMPYLQVGVVRITCEDIDEVMVYMTRFRQPARRRPQTIYDPDDRPDRIG